MIAIAAREPGMIAAHQPHREPLLAADPQATVRLGRRPLGVDPALEVDLRQVARLRGDGRKRPRHRRCVELGPSHPAAIVPQRSGHPAARMHLDPAMSATSAISDASQDGLLDELLTRLAERSREDGTVRAQPDETEASVEATVWRALALRLAGPAAAKRARAAGEAIARLQAEDGTSELFSGSSGRLLLRRDRHPRLARAARALAGASARAVAFLLAQRAITSHALEPVSSR